MKDEYILTLSQFVNFKYKSNHCKNDHHLHHNIDGHFSNECEYDQNLSIFAAVSLALIGTYVILGIIKH
jgi:hypothetical protein